MTFDSRITHENYDQSQTKDNNNNNSSPTDISSKPYLHENTERPTFIDPSSKGTYLFYERLYRTAENGEEAAVICMLESDLIDITMDDNKLLKIVCEKGLTNLLKVLLQKYKLRFLTRVSTIFTYDHNLKVLELLLKNFRGNLCNGDLINKGDVYVINIINAFIFEIISDKHEIFCLNGKCQCENDHFLLRVDDVEKERKGDVEVKCNDNQELKSNLDMEPVPSPSPSPSVTEETTETPRPDSEYKEAEVTSKPPLVLRIIYKDCYVGVKETIFSEDDLFDTSKALVKQGPVYSSCADYNISGNFLKKHGRPSFEVVWTNDTKLISEFSCEEKKFIKVPDTENTYELVLKCTKEISEWKHYLIKFPQEYFSDDRRNGPEASCIIGVTCMGENSSPPKGIMEMRKNGEENVEIFVLICWSMIIILLMPLLQLFVFTFNSYGINKDTLDTYIKIYPNSDAWNNMNHDALFPSLAVVDTKVKLFKLEEEFEKLKVDMDKLRKDFGHNEKQLPECLVPTLSVEGGYPTTSFIVRSCGFDELSVLRSCFIKDGNEHRVARKGECVVIHQAECFEGRWF